MPTDDKNKGSEKFKLNEKKWFYERVIKFEFPKRNQTVPNNSKEDRNRVSPYFIERACDKKVQFWLKNNTQGTLLITGYRGVGKSSSFWAAFDSLPKSSAGRKSEKKEPIKIEINLTSILSLRDFSFLMVKELLAKTGRHSIEYDVKKCRHILKTKLNFLAFATKYFPLYTFVLAAYYFAKHIDLPFSYSNLFILPLVAAIGCFFYWLTFIKEDSYSNDPLCKSIVRFLDRLDSSLEVTESQAHDVKFSHLTAAFSTAENVTRKNLLPKFSDSEIIEILQEIIRIFVDDSGIGRVVFVFDEIDKLKGFKADWETQDDKISEFEELIGKIKPILTEVYAVFIFIAGRETYLRWLMDQSRGDSVYSSIFDQVIEIQPFLQGFERSKHSNITEFITDADEKDYYLGNALYVKKLVQEYLGYKYGLDTKEGFLSQEKIILESFYRYLLWKSRGIPRKILQEIENHIENSPSGSGLDSCSCSLSFNSLSIKKIMFYSSLVEELYSEVVLEERLDNDGILNLMTLIDFIFKFHKTGFTYADLKQLTIAVDQDFELKNDLYFDLALQLVEGWWVEKAYGRRSTYVFQPHMKAEIDMLSNIFPEEAVSFKLAERDFKKILKYFNGIDETVEKQDADQRINSIRIQVGLGKTHMLMGDYFKAIEYFKKAIRLGNKELNRDYSSKIPISNKRLLTRMIAGSFLEIGYILERKQKISEAFTFYTSAFSAAYSGEKEYGHDIIEKTLSRDYPDLTVWYLIPDEAIDALTHISYVEWKRGKLSKAEDLLLLACSIAVKKENPLKVVSQMILLGFFRFRTGNIKGAKEQFSKLTMPGGTIFEKVKLPPIFYLYSHEALACCELSSAESGSLSPDQAYRKVLKLSMSALGEALRHLDLTSSQRRALGIKLFMLRLQHHDVLSLWSDSKGSNLGVETETLLKEEKQYYQIVNNIHSLATNRFNAPAGKAPISTELLCSLFGQVTWHLFRIMLLEHENNPLELDVSSPKKILHFLGECTEVFKEIMDRSCQFLKTPDTMVNDSDIENYSYVYKNYSRTEVLSCMDKMCDDFSNNENVLLFIEQAFLLCHRIQKNNMFTSSLADTSMRLGIFYFWYGVFDKEAKDSHLDSAEQFFYYSFNDFHNYQKSIPDELHSEQRCNLFLGDISYSRDKKNHRKIKKYYAKSLYALADDLENHFGSIPLEESIHYRETNLLPRNRMYSLAYNRARLIKISKQRREVFEKNGLTVEIGNPESIHQYSKELRALAHETFLDPDVQIKKMQKHLYLWRNRYEDIFSHT